MGGPIAIMLEKLIAAGASSQVIAIAIEGAEAATQSIIARRRADDAERQRRKRERDLSRESRESRDQKEKEKSPHTPLKEKEKTNTHEGDAQLEIDLGAKTEPTARQRRRESRLPDDWHPNIDDLAFARGILPAAMVDGVAAKFRDYWHARAGTKALKRDWSATWRNWCRVEVERLDARQPRLTVLNGGQSNGNYRRRGQGNGNSAAIDAHIERLKAEIARDSGDCKNPPWVDRSAGS